MGIGSLSHMNVSFKKSGISLYPLSYSSSQSIRHSFKFDYVGMHFAQAPTISIYSVLDLLLMDPGLNYPAL